MTAKEVINTKKDVMSLTGAWGDAFGEVERVGVWFVWGNSGNGKSSFVMQLCRELARHGRVVYNSLEEGAGLTMQNTLKRFDMARFRGRFQLLDCEPMEEMSERMVRRNSADFWVVDSFQYSQMTYFDYIRFKEAHRNKLVVFVSHASGSMPDGRSAKKVMYDASLKVWVEGFRAISKGRFIGTTGVYTIWEDGAAEYWGGKEKELLTENKDEK